MLIFFRNSRQLPIYIAPLQPISFSLQKIKNKAKYCDLPQVNCQGSQIFQFLNIFRKEFNPKFANLVLAENSIIILQKRHYRSPIAKDESWDKNDRPSPSILSEASLISLPLPRISILIFIWTYPSSRLNTFSCCWNFSPSAIPCIPPSPIWFSLRIFEQGNDMLDTEYQELGSSSPKYALETLLKIWPHYSQFGCC